MEEGQPPLGHHREVALVLTPAALPPLPFPSPQGLTSMDGYGLADSILNFAQEAPPNPAAFRAAMGGLFTGLDADTMRYRTSEVITDMMDMIRQHNVHLKGIVSTVVITTLVLEGWSTKLNPDIRILDTLRDLLPSARRERIGKTLDRAMSADTLALAAL